MAIRTALVLGLVMPASGVFAQSKTDSTQTLKTVTVSASKKPLDYTTAVPVQLLDNVALQQISTESVADAAKYFSGVLIKDFGGVGGLKTISVRGLDALNTGLLYDGVPFADAQTGQIDLSKFSSTFVQSLELDEANPQQILLPARAYSSASILAITTNVFKTNNFTQTKWKANLKQGSFGLWQPAAGIYLPVGKNTVISANAEVTWSQGDYPFFENNGAFSSGGNRTNSDLRSAQGEFNIVKLFSDSSTLQTKFWTYNSERGLPGSVIFFNDTAAQRLYDNDVFAQARYQRKLGLATDLLITAKYSDLFTRYVDPYFHIGTNGTDDHYTQQELYGSAAIDHHFGKWLSLSFASDIASTNLVANVKNFSNPARLSLWNSIAFQYARALWQVNGSLLNTSTSEKTELGPAADNKNEWTPTIAGSYKTNLESPFLLRAFYKNIYRLPTFNDVYYNYIISINPNLHPEFCDQYDAGITYSKNLTGRLKQFNISVDGYYNSVKNKIIAIPGQNLFVWTTTNLGKVQITGIDVNAELSGVVSNTIKASVRIAYTWQQALNITDPSASIYKNEIPYTPQNSGSALAVAFYKEWSGGYDFLFSGLRYSLSDNNASDELPGWATQDIFISRSLKCASLQAIIKAEVNNLFDERYDVVQSYPMPGRSYKISITFNNL